MDEAVAEADRQLAELLHVQQVQQKQDLMRLSEAHAVSNANAEFRRGLEQLVQDHLHACMAIANGGSSAHHYGPDFLGTIASGAAGAGSSSGISGVENIDCSGRIISAGPSGYSGASDGSGSGGCNISRSSSRNGSESSSSINNDITNSGAIDVSSVSLQTGCPVLLAGVAARDGSSEVDCEASDVMENAVASEALDISTSASSSGSFNSNSTSSHVQSVVAVATEDMASAASAAAAAAAAAAVAVAEMHDAMEAEAAARMALEQQQQQQHMRGADLLSLAGMQALSMLDASFLEASDSLPVPQPQPEQQQAGEEEWYHQQQQQQQHGSVADSVQGIVAVVGVGSSLEAVPEGAEASEAESGGSEEPLPGTGGDARNASPPVPTRPARTGSRPASPATSQTAAAAAAAGSLPSQPLEQPRDAQEARLLDLFLRIERERYSELASVHSVGAVTSSSSRNRIQAFMQHRQHLADTPSNTEPRAGNQQHPTQQLTPAQEDMGRLRASRFVSGLESHFRSQLESIIALGPMEAWENRARRQQQLQGTLQQQLQQHTQQRQQQQQPPPHPAFGVHRGPPIHLPPTATAPNARRNLPARAPAPPAAAPASAAPARAAAAAPAPLPLPRPLPRFNTGRLEGVAGLLGLPPSAPAAFVTIPPGVEGQQLSEYNEELQELMSRRSVTTILTSGFRHRLENLIRSFINRRHNPLAATRRNAQAPPTPPPPPPTNWRPTRLVPPPPPHTHAHLPPPHPPPPPPLPWSGPFPHTNLPAHVLRPSLPQHHRQPSHGHPSYPSYGQQTEGWMAVRDEVRRMEDRLDERLHQMDRLVHVCVGMMHELQRGQRQELAGALQRVYEGGRGVPQEALDGSRWALIRSGTCCVCCDQPINCLLYRCGHMCACLECAQELQRREQSCPMCRAPITEVVRAYTASSMGGF